MPLASLDRRQFGLLLLLSSKADWARAQAAASAVDSVVEHLRAGRCALLLRHALTDPGAGDPPDFKLGQCSTQRNLSEEGKAQARRTGEWFRTRQLQPSAVLSSAWCRCIDTATLAFGRHEPWAALNSTLGRGDEAVKTRPELHKRLARIASGRFEVWVSHQVNISAFTGEPVAMGQGVLVDREGKVIGRSSFSA